MAMNLQERIEEIGDGKFPYKGSWKHTFKSKLATKEQSKFYKVWENLRSRCHDNKNREYNSYGGRGIRCQWSDFQEFYTDMYTSFLEHNSVYGGRQTSLDRIDNDGNYDKKNCRWATIKEQLANVQEIQSNNKSGFRGVCKNKKLNKWVAQIGFNKKKHHLGYFLTAKKASEAYEKARKKYERMLQENPQRSPR